MAEYYTGTLLASSIVRGSSGDTYGTHHSVLGVGGYMEVSTIAERNALPIDTVNGIYYDGLSSGQRRLGMLVHVFEDNIIYHLQPNVTYSTWTGYTDGVKLNALGDNNNWQIFLSSGGTTATGENISKSFYQITHGFTGGTVIGFNGTNYQKVDSVSASTIEPLGIVTKIDDNNFILTYAGYISISGFVDISGNTLSGGTVYYLASTPGELTAVSPTNFNEISKPMLVALLSGNTGVVLQNRGLNKSDEGVTYGDFTGYTATTQIFLDKTVTGATNIGYFSGATGIQTIDVLTSDLNYSGRYTSLYNYYYRDNSGFIRLGSPVYHGSLRRGYLSNFTPKKSWLYNTYTGMSNQVGWIFVDGDISTSVGTFLSANNVSANAGTPVFTDVEWSYTGGTLNDGYYTNSAISLDVNGSFTTGSTYSIGGPVYSDKQYQELRFRTLMTSSPNTLKITYDDSFVYVSGATDVITGVSTAANVGTGAGVFKNKVNNILNFKTLVGSGGTAIYSNTGNTIVIYSTGGSAGGTYNLASPSVIPLGGICAGTVLTGKTSFQLFEELLVPELCGAITAPSTTTSLSASGLYEIGCVLSGGSSQVVCGTFSRGSINPQYCSISAFRSGCANAYCFVGTGMPSGLQSCALSPASQTISSYVVSAGTQSWCVNTRYAAGSPALGSKGTQYCAALVSGCTSLSGSSIVGAYPLFATSVSITGLTKQTLVNMSTSNNILLSLVTESSPDKQKFEIPCAWLSAPRPLVGVCQWNTVSSQWEYPGGSAACSLNLWSTTGTTETIQGSPIGYCRYTYNSVDRSSVCIRLVF